MIAIAISFLMKALFNWAISVFIAIVDKYQYMTPRPIKSGFDDKAD
jgi:hypothetical protein